MSQASLQHTLLPEWSGFKQSTQDVSTTPSDEHEDQTKRERNGRAGTGTERSQMRGTSVNGLEVTAFTVTHGVSVRVNMDDQAESVLVAGSIPNAVEKQMWMIGELISTAVDVFISKVGISKLSVDCVEMQHEHLMPMFVDKGLDSVLKRLGNVRLLTSLPVTISIQHLIAVACVRWIFGTNSTAQLLALRKDEKAQSLAAAEWARTLICVICSICDIPNQSITDDGISHVTTLEQELYTVFRHTLALSIVMRQSDSRHHFVMPKPDDEFDELSMGLADVGRPATGKVRICLFPGAVIYTNENTQGLILVRAVVC